MSWGGSLIYQIKRHIRRNFGAADQSPEQIARRFGISRRHLYQLLEPIGGIARYQRHLRLQRCLADLQSPEDAHVRISEIAYRWGFRNAATFNRSFRKAFEITPSEARAAGEARAVATSSPVQRGGKKTEKEHHQWFQVIGT